MLNVKSRWSARADRYMGRRECPCNSRQFGTDGGSRMSNQDYGQSGQYGQDPNQQQSDQYGQDPNQQQGGQYGQDPNQQYGSQQGSGMSQDPNQQGGQGGMLGGAKQQAQNQMDDIIDQFANKVPGGQQFAQR